MTNYEQFLLDRKTGLGGSDIASIMGLSPWRTALSIYLDKISDTSLDVDDADHKQFERGHRAEKYILEEYTDDNNVEIEVDLPQICDSTYSFLKGHPDGKVKNSNIYIEAKSYYGNLKDWNGEIPIYYKTQVAHYAYLTDADRVDVAVLADHWNYGCYTYFRDKDFENKIKQAAIDFWHNHVLKNIPPQITSINDGVLLYPNDDTSVKYPTFRTKILNFSI